MQANQVQFRQSAHGSARLKRQVFAAAAVLSAGVGLWMLVDPEGWFATIAGVEHTGPFNRHFVRDVGVGYLTAGAASAAAALWLRAAYPLLLVAAIWHAGHGFTHVQDILTGDLPMSHVIGDLPGVFIPGGLAIVFALWVRPEWRNGGPTS